MLYFTCLSTFIVSILILWFKTNAFVEYCNLLGLSKIVQNYNNDSSNLTYTQFLFVKRNNITNNKFYLFVLKLITCPLCLGLWLCIITGTLLNGIFYIPIMYIAVLFIYFSLCKLID
jgi:hypothetical protein